MKTHEVRGRKEHLAERSAEIVRWFTADYLRQDGLPVTYLDGIDGRIISSDHILNDLGDYLPFVRFFGNEQFCRQQIASLKLHLERGILKPRARLFGLPLSTAFEHTDLLLGLIDYYLLEKDDQIINLAVEITEQILKKLNRDNGFRSFYLHKLNLALPVFSSVDGTFIELLTNLYVLTEERRYLKIATDIWKRMRSIPVFRETSLFPNLYVVSNNRFLSRVLGLYKSFRVINLMKHNTNTLFGFLELYKVGQNPEIEVDINRWVDSVETNALSAEGGVYRHLESSNGTVQTRTTIDLTAGFAVIDFLCDCMWLLKRERFLTLAEKVADFWLNRQSASTGLFPAEADASYSYLDSETDMVIALMKLHELTSEDKYRAAALRAFDGVLEHHRTEKGYVLSVDITGGKIVNPGIKTKYVSLFMKALILFMLGKPIYQNPELHNLLKDR